MAIYGIVLIFTAKKSITAMNCLIFNTD